MDQWTHSKQWVLFSSVSLYTFRIGHTHHRIPSGNHQHPCDDDQVSVGWTRDFEIQKQISASEEGHEQQQEKRKGVI